jgi:hypothetical protein
VNQSRYQTNIDFKDSVSWLRSNHSLSFGGGCAVIQHNTSQNVAHDYLRHPVGPRPADRTT